jgi:putative ABC transport system permease protein
MNPRESVGIALGALRANKLRSFLTLLGTIIGVTSVIFVVSIVQGLNRYVTDKLLQAGSNVFYLDQWGFITSQEEWEARRNWPAVTVDDADALQNAIPHASMIVGTAGTMDKLRFREKVMKNVQINARGPGYEVIDDLSIADGRHLGELDDQRRRAVCIIGPEVAEELFPGLDAVGRVIRIGNDSFEIVGVTVAKGKLLGQTQDRFVTIPIRTFQKLRQERADISIAVKSIDQPSMELALQEVRTIMRGRRHLGPGRPDNFGITTADTWLDFYHTLTGGIFIVTIGVAAISLVVGGIVIMNIMLVSVTERTREIGVRKALGARRRDILVQFLVEATTLSLSGGVIGIVVGVLLALLMGALTPLPTAISMPAVLAGIVMSSVIGMFFGSYPAFRAARLDPIEALRYE